MRDTSEAFGRRFGEALAYAAQLHHGQFRKGTQIPYVSHLLSVAALVIEDGGSEIEAIAALLHDGPEDQGGLETLEAIRSRFGREVADIVAACSDTFEEQKPPWRERKEAYLEHLPGAPLSVRRVAAADKLHNARSVLADLRSVGEQLWDRFSVGREESLWFYRQCADILSATDTGSLAAELGRAVDSLERAARQGEAEA